MTTAYFEACKAPNHAFSLLYGAGAVYLQMSGGPIGARVTMAAGRLVMMKWGNNYRMPLGLSKMELSLLGGYVDDVRQGGSQIRYGLRWVSSSMSWSWSESARNEDIRLKLEGESPDNRMRRICLPVMNCINPDLKFTAEIANDFANSRLPTLDFELWLDKNGKVQQNYFQKPMKTPYVVMMRSAMSQPQKFSILTNELIRRLSNTDYKDKNVEEKLKVINQFTRELKQSEYGRLEVKEIIVSGMKGWMKKMERRLETGKLYRSGKSTLAQRCKKKLTAKTSWYKGRRKDKEEGNDNSKSREPENNARRMDKGRKKNESRDREPPKIKAVMFVQYTPYSELAKRL